MRGSKDSKPHKVEKTLPHMSSMEAEEVIEKMAFLTEDTKQLLELLQSDTSCFTRDGNGRLKKTEIINKLGWSPKRVDEAISLCKSFLDSI